jgi:hypothetical protein
MSATAKRRCKTDNLFTIHHYYIRNFKINQPVYLIPFGDVHRFASLCDDEKWKEFLSWAKSKPNALFLGMGDYTDLASYNERKILGSVDLHDFTLQTLDKLYEERCVEFIKEILFMKHHLIGLIEGNHHGVFSNSNFTTTQYMCQKLGCKYLGVSAFIRLSFVYGSKKFCVDVWAHHGRGASRTSGGSINTVEQMSNMAEADIFLMGHDHKKSLSFKNRLALSWGRGLTLTHRKILLGRTGSFLRGYVPETQSYIAHAAMSPTDLGVLKIELTPKRKTKKQNGKMLTDTIYTDIHAS